GEGLTLRGQSYGFGPLLSLMLASIILVAGSVDAAYDWFKIAEALVFALTTAWALYAIAVALERPTVLRQFLVLFAIGFAVLARTQFGILYVTWIVALGLLWLLAPWSRPRART